MITLSEASKDTKQAIKFGIITVAIIFILFMVFKMLVFFKNTFFPTPPPKPTMAFGKLTKIDFPKNNIKDKISYNINTLSGYLPKLIDQAHVFKTKGYQPDLLALQNAKEKAAILGFTNQPKTISETVFEWNNKSPEDITQTLTFDITDEDFTLTSDYIKNQSVISGANLPSKSEAIELAKALLGNLNFITDDLNTTDVMVNSYSIQNDNLVLATSLSNTQAHEVYFKQNNINEIPIVYEKLNSSNINFLITGGSARSQIRKITYFHQELMDDSATYPLKTIDQAYEDLQNGNAFIVKYPGDKTINIEEAFVAYYIGSKSQEFLKPVIVFRGNNNFTAYVSAIKDEWISN